MCILGTFKKWNLFLLQFTTFNITFSLMIAKYWQESQWKVYLFFSKIINSESWNWKQPEICSLFLYANTDVMKSQMLYQEILPLVGGATTDDHMQRATFSGSRAHKTCRIAKTWLVAFFLQLITNYDALSGVTKHAQSHPPTVLEAQHPNWFSLSWSWGGSVYAFPSPASGGSWLLPQNWNLASPSLSLSLSYILLLHLPDLHSYS